MAQTRTVTLSELVEHLCRHDMTATLEGDGQRQVKAVNTLEEAEPHEVSFLSNLKYEKYLSSTRAGAVIVGTDTAIPRAMPVIRTKDPYAALMAAVVLIHGHRQHPQWGRHAGASISDTARIGSCPNIGPHCTIEDDAVIGDRVVMYPGCYIGRGTRLGHDVVLFPNVVIYESCVIGNETRIHAGSIIGEDGLGYAPIGESWEKIPQVGNVVIEDDVEIGANCTIDRATLGRTVIGQGSKFSNLIAIGHGTKVGHNAMFVAQVGLAGSVMVGRHVQMGGQVGVTGHVTIGDNATIGAKAGVVNDIDAGLFVLGQPAIKASEAKRSISLMHKLPEMKQRLKVLEQEIADLREALTTTSSTGSPSG